MKKIIISLSTLALLFIGISWVSAASNFETINRNWNTVCKMAYDPVCGADGISYTNSCTAGDANIKISYNGYCLANDEKSMIQSKVQSIVTKQYNIKKSSINKANLTKIANKLQKANTKKSIPIKYNSQIGYMAEYFKELANRSSR